MLQVSLNPIRGEFKNPSHRTCLDVLISSGKKSKRGKCSEKREEEKSEKEETNQVFLAQESFVWDVNLVPVQKMRPKSK